MIVDSKSMLLQLGKVRRQCPLTSFYLLFGAFMLMLFPIQSFRTVGTAGFFYPSKFSGAIHRTAKTMARSTSKSLADFREEYSKDEGLDESMVSSTPYPLFQRWFDDAKNAKVVEPNAMCLSTTEPTNGRPSSRYVLLKGFDERGWVWYTNYESRKGQELSANPWASLVFWWGDLHRSVRIEGKVEKVSAEESDEYFYSRPVGSQLGAMVSTQSRPVQSRSELEAKFQELTEAAEKNPSSVVRPPHWGGFRLTADRVEFWHGRSSRLHDRLVYTRPDFESVTWSIERLQP